LLLPITVMEFLLQRKTQRSSTSLIWGLKYKLLFKILPSSR
jgi:hypothetical protein